jgi:GNAT superfamily N-acetyltransferase
MTIRQLAGRAATNMGEFERRRAAFGSTSADLCFPRNIRSEAEYEALVTKHLRSEAEVWAWRHVDSPLYIAQTLKHCGFEYVFPGTLLVAETQNAVSAAKSAVKGLELHPVDTKAATPPVHPWYGDLSDPKARIGLERDHKTVEQNPKRFVNLLAWHENVPLGSVTVYFACGVAGLYSVAVEKSRRGQGFGKVLIAETLRYCYTQGFSLATLQCASGLQDFYARNGFRRVGAVDAWKRTADVSRSTAGETQQRPDTIRETLRTAVEGNALEQVRKILDKRPELLLAGMLHWSGATPLHVAAWLGYVELVRVLLERGASPNARENQFNGLPIDWARHGKRTEVVQILESAK